MNKQEIRHAHRRILYNAYKDFFYAGDLEILNGFVKTTSGEEANYINDLKFMIQRLECDIWRINNEFENIIIMNAYRLPEDTTIEKYPCIIEFFGELVDGARMVFTHEVRYE